jgi:putative transposase
MARRLRLPSTDLPLHVVQRGNDRQRCFLVDGDYEMYLRTLREGAVLHGVQVHAYVLMTNHVHLLVAAKAEAAVSRLMQSIGARYVRYFNRRHERTGTLWEGRYKSCLVASDQHLLAACRYIDLNPVRAGIVRHPGEYRWSSYRTLVGARNDALVTPHELLASLGPTREAGYAIFCGQMPYQGEIDDLRAATAAQGVFGPETLKLRIAAALARPRPARRTMRESRRQARAA